MQVKKFEAPTIQEALENIKRELGPEAIILQTKKNKRGFGLMSKASVEVTAAISDRSMHKKSFADDRMPEPTKNAVKDLPASRQAEIYDKYLDKHLEKAKTTSERVEVRGRRGVLANPTMPLSKKLTATRYVEIDRPNVPAGQAAPLAKAMAASRVSTSSPLANPGAVAQSAGKAVIDAIAQVNATPSGSGAIAGEFGMQGMSVAEEVHHLKRMIEELKNVQDSRDGHEPGGAQAFLKSGAMHTPALQDAFEQLVIGGVDKRYAYALIKAVAFELGEDSSKSPEQVLDQLAGEIIRTTEVSSALRGIESGGAGRAGGKGPAVIALVGPTGVGKTTTVAKMASEGLLKRGLKVGLINLDSYKVAAFDQLGTYAKILNMPFRSAGNKEDLSAAILDFQSLDLILVDTTGRSQRDPGALREMQHILESVNGMRTHLVLSVTTRDAELYDMANRFAVFKPEGIIVSKLDEATLYGAIFNVSQKVKLPLLYFTTGQRVPEDIEEASQERVASLILSL